MNILVIRMHRFGDILQLTPMLQGLKKKYPACRITFFTDSEMSNRVHIACADLTVEAGGKIDADGKGFDGDGNSLVCVVNYFTFTSDLHFFILNRSRQNDRVMVDGMST